MSRGDEIDRARQARMTAGPALLTPSLSGPQRQARTPRGIVPCAILLDVVRTVCLSVRGTV